MSKEPITWDQIEALVFQLKQVAQAAHKAAASLTRHQIQPTNRIKTLETQRHELDKSCEQALRSLDRYTSQLRHRYPENHPGALPSGAPDQPGRDPEVSQ